MWAAEIAARDIQIKIKKLTKKVIREEIYESSCLCFICNNARHDSANLLEFSPERVFLPFLQVKLTHFLCKQ